MWPDWGLDIIGVIWFETISLTGLWTLELRLIIFYILVLEFGFNWSITDGVLDLGVCIPLIILCSGE